MMDHGGSKDRIKKTVASANPRFDGKKIIPSPYY
jgi:hypothetical protein